MAVAETNKIITHGDGQSIATSIQNIANAINDQEKNVHLSDAQTITGAKTFTSPIKTSEIDNTAGNAMLRNKDTEGAIVLGSVSKKAVIMGSGDRPTYSKDGSDFTGSELALKSDVIVDASTLWANLGIGRWANQSMHYLDWEKPVIYDGLAKYYSNCTRYLDYGKFISNTNSSNTKAIHFSNPTSFFNPDCRNFTFAFSHYDNVCDFYLPSFTASLGYNQNIFTFSKFTKILIDTNCSVKIGGILTQLFSYMPNLTEIGEIEFMAGAVIYGGIIDGDSKLKRFGCKNIRFSLDLSPSTAFEEADLVEVIGNLVDVGADRTLTIGTTNRAKLTAEEIAVATIKGWTIA